ncbi:MAG: HAD-IA family hydrolase [Acidimicrobiia bacterium]|nr:HAD-IA family hydrolase [Acidimicrobiia bacterium]
MLDRSAIDAVVFDIGGVFLIPHGPSVRTWFDGEGFVVAVDDDAYHRAHYEGVRALAALDHRLAETDPEFWSHYDHAYLAAIGINEDRLVDARAAFGRLFAAPSLKMWTGVVEANVAGFARIVASGMPTAIVSNNDGTAEAQLLEHKICQVGPGELSTVVCVVDSTLLGVAKPDPAIFTPALEALGVEGDRALYVGDTVHADVAGARAAGLQVVQLDPYDLHADFDHARFPDVGALADWLLVP